MYRWRIVLALAIGGALLGGAAQAQGADRQPVYTNKTKFRIPFNSDSARLTELRAKAIVLYSSTDRGTSWKLVQTVAPDAGKFNFQAESDGEIWFVVRTLDASDRLVQDTRALEPELQVIVDTKEPDLKLELFQPSAGRVQLRWNANDSNLDPSQLRLEYLQPGTNAWRNVGIVPKASGQTEWTITNGGQVSVRGVVADYARNVGRDQVQLKAGGTPVPAFNSREPVADGQDNFQAASGLRAPGAQTVPVRPASGVPAESASRFIPARSTGGDEWNGAPVGNFSSRNETADESPARSPYGHRVVASRDFHINYKLQDVGPSGISSVHLYMTQDNGANWTKYGEDSDAQSPFTVRVLSEGIYGFAIVPQSGVGLSADLPQAGDKPQTVIVVDQTAPVVELLPLEQGRGKNLNKILIQWRMEEQFPTDKPIALSYAISPQGPWQPISGWTENTGRYIWSIGHNVPPKFYVRLEARDIAGNTQSTETPDPVIIDLSRPTARIVDVESQSSPDR